LLKQIIKHKKYHTSNSNYSKTSKYEIKKQLVKKKVKLFPSPSSIKKAVSSSGSSRERLATSRILATSNKFHLSLPILHIFVAPSL
jgi:hypothetical protein